MSLCKLTSLQSKGWSLRCFMYLKGCLPLPSQAMLLFQQLHSLKSMHLLRRGDNLEKQVVVWKKPPSYIEGEPMQIVTATKKPEDAGTKIAEEEPARASRAIQYQLLPLTDTTFEFPVSKPESKIIGSSSGPVIDITLPEQPKSPPVAPKANKGKGIATDDIESPKMLVKASTVVRPDPDELIRVPYEIHGKMCQLTNDEIQAHLDKEENIKKAAEEAKLLAMSKPKLIKVVHEEASNVEIDPKVLSSAKGGQEFKKIQDIELKVLNRELS
ncbi:hypothetical protein Tco_0117394 [Tanacetum coccineum]